MAKLEELFELEADRASTVEELVTSLERALGASLPLEYRTFVERSRGGPLPHTYLSPIASEYRYEASWMEVGELLGAEDQLDAIEVCREWEHPVSGLVLDQADGHRTILLAVSDAKFPDGTVVLSDLECDQASDALIVLARTFNGFVTGLRDDDEAFAESEQELDQLNLGADATDDELRARVKHLSGRVVAVRSVQISGSGFTDEGMRSLASLVNLRHLDIAGTSVQFDGLVALGSLPLSSLDLRRTQVSLNAAKAQTLRRQLGSLVRISIDPEQLDDSVEAWVAEHWPGLALTGD